MPDPNAERLALCEQVNRLRALYLNTDRKRRRIARLVRERQVKLKSAIAALDAFDERQRGHT